MILSTWCNNGHKGFYISRPASKNKGLQSTWDTEKKVFVNYNGHCHVWTEGTVVQLASAMCEREVPYERQRCALNYDLVHMLCTIFCVFFAPCLLPPTAYITITLRQWKVTKPDARGKSIKIWNVLMHLHIILWSIVSLSIIQFHNT